MRILNHLLVSFTRCIPLCQRLCAPWTFSQEFTSHWGTQAKCHFLRKSSLIMALPLKKVFQMKITQVCDYLINVSHPTRPDAISWKLGLDLVLLTVQNSDWYKHPLVNTGSISQWLIEWMGWRYEWVSRPTSSQPHIFACKLLFSSLFSSPMPSNPT